MCDELSQSWTWIEGGVGAPQGFQATGVKAEVKYKDKYDIALIYSSVPAQAAGVFTRNQVKAHPLVLTQKFLENGVAQAIVANSGNANACVGEAGDRAALAMAETAAAKLGIKVEDVLVASTGVIGVEMPVERVKKGIEDAAEVIKGSQAKPVWTSLEKSDNAHRAALAIMTTDTAVKEFACELPCQGGVIRLGGIAKGSGMIHPNMGTMLGFLTTDARLSADQLQELLRRAADQSFNMVTVDGDTSTNDMVLFLANGESGITPAGKEWIQFKEMVNSLCIRLAQEIARDGEGATKFLEVKVTGAKTLEDARKLAKSICGSSLVKTAMYGEDANWGRILAAAGYAEAQFDPSRAAIYLGDCLVARNGQGVHFSEEAAKEVLAQKEIRISLMLNDGEGEATAWGCDLTHEYVTINGDYRT